MASAGGFRVEWRSRVAFAELAEALGVATDEIMAASAIEGGRGYLVLFTRAADGEPDPVVREALLERDTDGLLVPIRRRSFDRLSVFLSRLDQEDLPDAH